MRRRIYRDGQPAWSDNEPARARVAGYGGSLVTHTLTVAPPVRTRLPRDPLSLTRGIRPVCGFIMPTLGQPCMRGPHDNLDHRSPRSMAGHNRRRAL